MLRSLVLAFGVVLCVSLPALAGQATYVLETPGVV